MQQKIAIIGTGNVAWHLSLAFENAGHVVTEVYGRDIQKAERLIMNSYQAEATSHLDFSRSEANIFIMAVSDDAVEGLVRELILPDGSVLAHTSGTLSIKALGYAPTEDIGVFYPLQTLSKAKNVDFQYVPICIEGETLKAQNDLASLASSISTRVQMLDSGHRRLIHLAAVFACNFTNHMLTLSKEILRQQEIDFTILHPLISETLNKSLEIGPEKAQTGPAVRQDMETLDKQHQALQEDEQVAEIYQIVSQHILDFYS